LQAIDKRLGSGAGTLIDLSQFECSVAMIGSLLLQSAVDRRIPPRLGNRSERFAPQGVYRCAGTDRWCALSVETDEQWKKLARIIGRESWTDEPRFARAAGRFRHHDEIDRAITAWTVKQADKDIEQQLKSLGIPAERVRRIDEVVDSPDASRVFDAMSERRVGSMRTTRLPFSLSSVELPPPRSAPSLGEHSAEVLREWLHCSDEEIEELRKSEALQ
jgi:crotonobetainyl-CoA:carnitine CoA-transferase CaiB-like acyl-CoA transferase